MSKINVHKATIRKFSASRRRTVQEERACCGEPWLVLADPSDSTSWKNDRSLIFEKCDELNVTVQKKGAVLALPAQGVSVAFPNDPDTQGFIIDWRLYYDVDNELIQGQYDVFVETVIGGVTERFLWNTFMLMKYSEQNAEGTVRIFSYFNHYSELYDIDFSGSGALDTVRFRGFFGYRQPNYETKNNTEISKKREKVFNKTNNVYGLIVEPTVECKTQRIEELHLLHGSVIYVSDHNDFNHNIANDVYKDLPVILSNDESPEFDYFEGIGTKYAKVLAKFKDKISKRKSRNTGTGENILIPDVGLWNGVVCPTGGGGDCVAATAVLRDTDGNTISTTNIASGASANITAPDGSITLLRESGATIRTVSVMSNESKNETILNTNVQLIDTDGNNIGAPQSFGAEGSGTITAPDGTVTVNRDGVFYADVPVASGGTSTIDVPSDCPAPSLPQGGMLPFKSGQTTVYETGDDGSTQRGQSFTVLPFTNPFGNTTRFLDTLGGTTYANEITLDLATTEWASPTTGTFMGYVFVNVIANWATQVANALAATHGGYSGWAIINDREMGYLTVDNGSVNDSLNHSGLLAPDNVVIHTGKTNPNTTTRNIVRAAGGFMSDVTKTTNGRRVDARLFNFSVVGGVVILS